MLIAVTEDEPDPKIFAKNGDFLARVLCDNLHPRNSPLKQSRENECLEPECDEYIF